MKNLNLLKQYFFNLSTKGKLVFTLAFLITAIIVIEIIK